MLRSHSSHLAWGVSQVIVRVKLEFRVLWMRKSEEGYKIIAIGLQRLGFNVKREPLVLFSL